MKKIERLSYKESQLISLGLLDDYKCWSGHLLFFDLSEREKMNLWNRGINEAPLCKTCNQSLKTTHNLKKPFSSFCNSVCKNRNPEKIQSQISKLKETESQKSDDQRLTKSRKIKEAKSQLTQEEKKLINEKRKSTCLSRYGVENVRKIPEKENQRIEAFRKSNFKENFRKTCNEKYGVNHPWQSQSVKDLIRSTMISRYGVENPQQSLEIREKREKTCNEKYGVNHPWQSQSVKDLIRSTMISRYGVENPFSLNGVIETIKEKRRKKILKYYQEIDKNVIDYQNQFLTMKCEKTQNEYRIHTRLFNIRKKTDQDVSLISNPIIIQNSSPCNHLLAWIRSIYTGPIEINNRKILNGKEIDIFLPEHSLGIEFNGNYWHSEFFKEKKYHQEKTLLSRSSNIRLIHIWSDDWEERREIVKSIIMNALQKNERRIWARSCEIKEIKALEYNQFCYENHIQSSENSAKIRIGLFYKGELVSIMSFGRLRKINNMSSNEGDFELIRMCNKRGISIVGGFSKQFRFFCRNYSPRKIISYANLDYFSGSIYESLGMNLKRITEPNYWWCIGKNSKRMNRYNFTKTKLKKMGFDDNLSESEIMYEFFNSFRVFGSGSLLYEINFD